jgi:predicted nucleic acid-binding protein
MIRAALDSNILVYAELEPDSDKGRAAQFAIAATAPRGLIAVQSLLEFLAVVRRKRPESLPSAIAKLEAWAQVFETVPTTLAMAEAATALVRDHDFQVWDAVIWTAVRSAGAHLFLTEDLQNGFSLGGVKALNPLRMSPDQLEHELEG